MIDQLLQSNNSDSQLFYFINLESSAPHIEEATIEEVSDTIVEHKVQHWKDLNDYDFKLFDNKKEAQEFFSQYMTALKSLDNKRICNSRDLPCLLYKRRYIVQSLLGLKNQTYRHYLKDFKKGDLINLHDQTYFLTVQIESVTKEGKNYCYKFKLPNK